MKIIYTEIKKSFAQFKKHYVQYTLMFVVLVLLGCTGLYFRLEGYGINNYERLTYFGLIYYLIILRSVSNGISTPYGEIMKEQYESKLLSNVTICNMGQKAILYSRCLISSLINIVLTFISIITLIIMLGMQYSAINYVYLFIVYLLATWFMYGIGILYTCVCKFFRLEKIVAMFFQILLIVYFLISSNDQIYNLFGRYKDEIYYILYGEIINATTYACDWSKVLLLLLQSVIIVVLSGIVYDYVNYRCVSRKRKSYERKSK